MCPDTHHKYRGVIPITFEDIANRDRAFFIRPHSNPERGSRRDDRSQIENEKVPVSFSLIEVLSTFKPV